MPFYFYPILRWPLLPSYPSIIRVGRTAVRRLLLTLLKAERYHYGSENDLFPHIIRLYQYISFSLLRKYFASLIKGKHFTLY